MVLDQRYFGTGGYEIVDYDDGSVTFRGLELFLECLSVRTGSLDDRPQK